MLHNPWNRPPAGVAAEPLDARALPESLRSLARRRLGDSYEPGFGYISTVLVGSRSVLKFDRFPGRVGRFDHERAVSGFEIDALSVPQILDAGVTDGYEWIEQSVVQGIPAYFKWNDLDSAQQRELMDSLGRAISQMQKWPVDRRLLVSDYSTWPAHVDNAVERAIVNAAGVVDEGALEAADERANEWRESLVDGERVTCHGDLWFGNVFVDADGKLSGIIDWDRLAVAPPEYELDMLWRFWRYPWNFVPEEWEAAYADQLPPGLLHNVVYACVSRGGEVQAAATLNLLELAYRLGMARRFGWGSDLQPMLETVLSGDWTSGLLDNVR